MRRLRQSQVVALILGLLAVLALLVLAHAVLAGPPTAEGRPIDADRPGWILWLDHQLVPAVHFFADNPVLLAIAIGLLLYLLVYLPIAVSLVWAIKAKFKNDRSACSFPVLFLWNVLEFTALSPWIMLGRTARHYWPVPSFKPWEPDTSEGKAPPAPKEPGP